MRVTLDTTKHLNNIDFPQFFKYNENILIKNETKMAIKGVISAISFTHLQNVGHGARLFLQCQYYMAAFSC